MPLRKRHGVFPLGSIPSSQTSDPLDMSSFQAAIIYHTDDVTWEGSADGGATWHKLPGSGSGNGADVVEKVSALLRVTASGAGAATVWVEGLRNVGTPGSAGF